jgi:hypothetical protein
MNQKKNRGIRYTEEPIGEDEPVTTINRFGQKTLHLPRITDDKRFAGYPGLTGVSRKIASLIPKCKYYVEPLAGTAKVWQAARPLASFKPKRIILNDTSLFVTQWLCREFPKKDYPELEITSEDFLYCIIQNDSEDTFFLIDQPWNKSFYKQGFSSFNRESVSCYDEDVLALCRNMKGKFIITTKPDNRRMLNSGFTNMIIESEYTVCGRYPKTLITTNMDV